MSKDETRAIFLPNLLKIKYIHPRDIKENNKGSAVTYEPNRKDSKNINNVMNAKLHNF